jgi:tetratricopeptide (TPR) repeat protein
MKYTYIILIGFLFLNACKSEPKSSADGSVEDPLESMNKIANQIIDNGLDPKLKFQNTRLGKELYRFSSLHLINNDKSISDSLKECLYQWAALGAEASDHYDDAITYFYKAQRNFPNSVNAPKYLHNRARILEDKIMNNNAARLAYEELIELYPDHPLSVNSKIYLENIFDKSDSEILNLIQAE